MILVVLHCVLHYLLFVCFISFLFIAVHGVIHHSVDGVDSIVLFCMPVSAVVSLDMICLYAVITSNQINKINKFLCFSLLQSRGTLTDDAEQRSSMDGVHPAVHRVGRRTDVPSSGHRHQRMPTDQGLLSESGRM